MTETSLLGHLSLRLSVHPENIATEALTIVLKRSRTASVAFRQFIGLTGVCLPDSLSFEAQQVGLDRAIPDLRCVDESGRTRAVVENKFWAGLTENQPVTYIRELAHSEEAVVLFVVPDARRTTIWTELLTRCSTAGLQLSSITQSSAITFAHVTPLHCLAITSWRNLLDVLNTAVVSSGDMAAANDIAQLRGLCNAIDSEAFLPLRPDELSNVEIPRRVTNLADVVFEIVQACEALNYCDRKGLKETNGRYTSGTYLKFGLYGAWFGLHVQLWKTFEISPLWFEFSSSDFGKAQQVRELLRVWSHCSPPRCLDWNNNEVVVPAILPTGVDKEKIIAAVVQQVAEMVALLNQQETQKLPVELPATIPPKTSSITS
jgi:hypothetical protein